MDINFHTYSSLKSFEFLINEFRVLLFYIKKKYIYLRNVIFIFHRIYVNVLISIRLRCTRLLLYMIEYCRISVNTEKTHYKLYFRKVYSDVCWFIDVINFYLIAHYRICYGPPWIIIIQFFYFVIYNNVYVYIYTIIIIILFIVTKCVYICKKNYGLPFFIIIFVAFVTAKWFHSRSGQLWTSLYFDFKRNCTALTGFKNSI